MDKKDGNGMGLVAYCGLCCTDCQGYKGTIPGLAKDLRKELKKARYETFASEMAKLPFCRPFEHYDEFIGILELMAKFRCRKGCRKNGGPPSCRIRECCREKEIAGCWECSEPAVCQKLTFLAPVHGDAHLKNIETIRKKGVDAYLAGKREW